MQSPYKRIIVYDLETGGLRSDFNSITEIAMVAIDLENLEIIDTFSTLIKPYMDLRNMEEDDLKEAKILYKTLGEKDEDSGVKTLYYKDHNITLKNLDPLVEGVGEFRALLERNSLDKVLTYDQIVKLQALEETKDIFNIFFDKSYNPQALRATKIPRELFEGEGVVLDEAFSEIEAFIKKHTIGNAKPIMAGHNIGTLPRRFVNGKEKGPDGFDNPFMEILFLLFKKDFFSVINEKLIDTLKEARIRWWELPSYSLGICANEVGLTLKEAHRALPDTEANAKFLIKMLENLRGVGQAGGKERVKRKFNFNF